MRIGAYEHKFVRTKKRAKKPEKPSPPALQILLLTIADQHNCTPEDMRGSSRKRMIVRARSEFCRIAWAMKVFSLKQIGKVLNRHHSTVIYLAGVLEKKPQCFKPCEQDRWIQKQVDHGLIHRESAVRAGYVVEA